MVCEVIHRRPGAERRRLEDVVAHGELIDRNYYEVMLVILNGSECIWRRSLEYRTTRQRSTESERMYGDEGDQPQGSSI